MSDKDKLMALFDSFGIVYTQDPQTRRQEEAGSVVSCNAGMGKINGYFGFYTEFLFDQNGKFIEMGVWE